MQWKEFLREGVQMRGHSICFQEEIRQFTLKCLNFGTPKTINFPFVPNGKLTVFRCPNIKKIIISL